MVHTRVATPFIAVSTTGIIAILMMIPSDVKTLVYYFSFASWLVYGATAMGVMVLRIKEPHAIRPIKIPIIVPFIVVLASVYLIAAPIISNPTWEFIYVSIFILAGIILYIPLVCYKYQPRFMEYITIVFQLLLEVVPPSAVK